MTNNPEWMTPPTRILIKLASLADHVAEGMSPTGTPVDLQTAAALANDPEVVTWLGMIPAALLPVRRK